jgi:predicted dithiol-disulfide oxidoreductase (DUF899 family)
MTDAEEATEWWTQLKSVTLHVEGEAPPLWSAGASDEYQAARMALVEAEQALSDQVAAVAAQRGALPPGPVLPSYALTEGPIDLSSDGPTRRVALADLFGAHDELVVYHLMFHPDDDAACAMCSLWVDGLHGVAHHITRRAALAVVAKAPIETLRAWGRRRGWHGLRLVSAYGTTFTTDVGTEGSRGGQVPAFSVFTRSAGEVRHAYIQSADFPDGRAGGIDRMSPVWNVFDLLPSGRGDWLPDNTYPGATRGEAR